MADQRTKRPERGRNSIRTVQKTVERTVITKETTVERTTKRNSEPTQRREDVTIALLGVTGAGKSTFASLASGRDDVDIGYGVDPCTQHPQAVGFRLEDGRRVTLIDTPGFDDDKRTDVQIMEDIATWMARRGYTRDQRLNGLIFLHPITLNRVGGSEWSRTRLLEKILGPDACSRVIIATTMWDEVTSETAMNERLNGRVLRGGVWYDMCQYGARIMKHYNNKESALALVQMIIDTTDKHGKVEPILQSELKERQGRVVETSAGRELEKQIQGKIRILEDEIFKHSGERPPASFKKNNDAKKREEWKEWQKEHRALQQKLEVKQKELKKLRNVVFEGSVYSFLSFFAWGALV